MKKLMKNFRRMETGAITYMTAVMLTVLLGMTALAVDVGLHYYYGAKLQNAADAAVMAVAANLDATQESQREIAYEYLAKNGFDAKNGSFKNKIEIELAEPKYSKAEHLAVDDDKYITGGYYKLVVKMENATIFGRILDIDALSMRKEAYAKTSINYIKVPRALKYTIFGGSTKGKQNPNNPVYEATVQLGGQTGSFLNTTTGRLEDAFNNINEGFVQPLIGFFGGDMNLNQKFRFNLNYYNVEGDVHSNRDIDVSAQALDLARVKDEKWDKFLHDLANSLKEDSTTFDIKDYYDDYGQVTFTAAGPGPKSVDDPGSITFHLNVLNRAEGDWGQWTHLYVQNQQYTEVTQVALRILEAMLNDENLNLAANASADAIKKAYPDYARDYIENNFYLKQLGNTRKEYIIKVLNGGLSKDDSAMKLFGQTHLVYDIHYDKATEMKYNGYTMGFDALAELVNNDGEEDTVQIVNNRPHYDPGDEIYNDHVAANHAPLTQSFLLKNPGEDDEKEITVSLYGPIINRTYHKITNPEKRTTNGALFAISRTFQEGVDQIYIPNLKPYFRRAINNSVRNATKIRELRNTSDAGQSSVREAVKWAGRNYDKILKNTFFVDDTEKYDDGRVGKYQKYKLQEEAFSYTEEDVYEEADGTISTQMVTHSGKYRQYVKDGGFLKDKAISDLINTSRIDYDKPKNSSFNIGKRTYLTASEHKEFRNETIFGDNDKLKTPTELLNDKKAKLKIGQDAIDDFYNKTAKTYETYVTNHFAGKKEAIANDLKDGLNGDYSTYKAKAQKDMNSALGLFDLASKCDNIDPEYGNPSGNASSSLIAPPSLPNTKEVFLGEGTVYDGTNTITISSTDKLRSEFDATVSSAMQQTPTITNGIEEIRREFENAVTSQKINDWDGTDKPLEFNTANCTGTIPDFTARSTIWGSLSGWDTDNTSGGNVGDVYLKNKTKYPNIIKTPYYKKNAVSASQVKWLYVNAGNQYTQNAKIVTNGDILLDAESEMIVAQSTRFVTGKLGFNGGNSKAYFLFNIKTDGILKPATNWNWLKTEIPPESTALPSYTYINGNIELQKNMDFRLCKNANVYVKGDMKTVGSGYSTIVVESGATLVVYGNIWLHNWSELRIEEGATVICKGDVLVDTREGDTHSGAPKNATKESGYTTENSRLTVKGTLIQLGKTSANGACKINADKIEVTNGGKIYAAGKLALNSWSKLTADANSTIVCGSMDINGATVNINGRLALMDTTQTPSLGAYTVQSPLYIAGNVTATSLSVNNGGSLTVGGNLNGSSSLSVKNGGSLTAIGNLNASSVSVENGGNLTACSNVTTSGEFTVNGTFTHTGEGRTITASKITLNTSASVAGNINTASLITNGSANTFVCKGTITTSGDLSVRGKLIVNNLVENNDPCIKAGSITITSGSSIYATKNIRSMGKISLNEGASLYCLGSVYAKWNHQSGQEQTMLEASGNDVKVYIRGELSSNTASSYNFDIVFGNGSGAVLSVLGEGFDKSIQKCRQINFQNTGNIYLGRGASIVQGNNLNSACNGSLYCYGKGDEEVDGLSFGTNREIRLNGDGVTYCVGDFTAPNVSSNENSLKILSGHLLYVTGKLHAKYMYLDASKVHATELKGTKITGKNNAEYDGTLKYETQSFENGSGQAQGSLNLLSLDFTASYISSYCHKVDINYRNMTLNNVRMKVARTALTVGDRDVKLSGNMTLTDTELYIDGNLSVDGKIKLVRSKLYVNGYVVSTGSATNDDVHESIELTADSILYVQGNTLNNSVALSCGTSYNKSTGLISYHKKGLIARDRSKVYVANGPIKTHYYKATNYAEIIALGGANFHYSRNGSDYADYSFTNENQIGSGPYYYTDTNATIFVGENTSVEKKIGIWTGGYLYLPGNKKIETNYLRIRNGGYLIAGDEGQSPTTGKIYIEDWAFCEADGHFYNFGLTEIDDCAFTNHGYVYCLGGVKDDDRSNPFETFPNEGGSETFIGQYTASNGKPKTEFEYPTLELNGGDVYIDGNIKINNCIRDETKKLNGSEGVHLALLVHRGTLYVSGNVTIINETSDKGYTNQSAIRIGDYDDNNAAWDNTAGLICGGNLTINSVFYNFGKMYVFGKFTFIQGEFCTDRRSKPDTWLWNSSRNDRWCASFINGRSESSADAVLFAKKMDNTLSLEGHVQNYGQIYIPANLDVKGWYTNRNNGFIGAAGYHAFINGADAQAHIKGWVHLNGNQLLNKGHAKFTCGGELLYGQIINNAGNLYVGGNIKNDERNSGSVNNAGPSRYWDDNLSLTNGVIADHDENSSRTAFTESITSTNCYPDAEIYCGGTLQIWYTRDEGNNPTKPDKGGSIISLGSIFVKENMHIYTWDKPDLVDGFNLGVDQSQHSSYFYSAYIAGNNSKTVVGGNFYAGAGVAVGYNSLFMCGGNYDSLRATKFGITVDTRYEESFKEKKWVFTYVEDDYTETVSTSGEISNYIYVGGNFTANRLGKRNNNSGANATIPRNPWRDTDIYSNTSMYVGGWFVANSKLNMHRNVNIIVNGDNPNDSIDSMVVYNSTKKKYMVRDGVLLHDDYNIVSVKNNNDKIQKAMDNFGAEAPKCRFLVMQSMTQGIGSSLIVNGSMYVQDAVDIKDMCKNYIYGAFKTKGFFHLGQAAIPLIQGNGSAIKQYEDETWAMKEVYRSARERAITAEMTAQEKAEWEAKYNAKYKFDNSAYMFIDGNFSCGKDPFLGIVGSTVVGLVETLFNKSYGDLMLYASATLRVNGSIDVKTKLFANHDTNLYAAGNCTVNNAITIEPYSNVHINGHLVSKYSTIDIREQVVGVIGGDLKAPYHVKLGAPVITDLTRPKQPQVPLYSSNGVGGLKFERGRSCNDFSVANGIKDANGDNDDLLDNGHDSNTGYGDFSQDDLQEGEGTSGGSIPLPGEEGQPEKPEDGYTGDEETEGGGIDDMNGTEGTNGQLNQNAITVDTSKINSEAEANSAYGAELYIRGSIISTLSKIELFPYTFAICGGYVSALAPYQQQALRLHYSADLWALPEMYDNVTYQYQPYVDIPNANSNIILKIFNAFMKLGYEFTEATKKKNGSIYVVGRMTLGNNASIFGTYNNFVLGQCVLSKDTLVYMGHNFESYIFPTIPENLKSLYLGFVSYGDSEPAWKYTCLNVERREYDGEGNLIKAGSPHYETDPETGEPTYYHYYNMYTPRGEDDPIPTYNKDNPIKCDCKNCNKPIEPLINPKTGEKYSDQRIAKKAQLSRPVVIYAQNWIHLYHTMDTTMTYMIANKGDVNIFNLFYGNAQNSQSNLIELPNALCSYKGNVKYRALHSRYGALFYAPEGSVDFDGFYSEIWGCVLGYTVTANTYNMQFHRFDNWNTMNLRLAKSGEVSLISKRDYEKDRPPATIYDEDDIKPIDGVAEGAWPFF